MIVMCLILIRIGLFYLNLLSYFSRKIYGTQKLDRNPKKLTGIMRLPLNFISFRAHKMSQFSTVIFMAGAAVMLTTLLLVDADSTTECLKDNHDVSLYKNALPRNIVLF
jgi:hypothetical protein